METAFVTGIGGASVLGSYWALGRASNTSYAKSPLWLGYSRSTIYGLIGFQLLAAVGFLVAIVTWVGSHPVRGILGRNRWSLPLTLAALMASSAAWSFSGIHMLKGGSATPAVIATTIAAASSIVLIMGAVTERPRRWWVIAGLVVLGITTVCADGIAWGGRALLRGP